MDQGSSSSVQGLKTEWEKLRLAEEDEGGMEVVAERVEAAAEVTSDFRFCILGWFLTEKPINFIAMKYTLASIWEPGKGINGKYGD